MTALRAAGATGAVAAQAWSPVTLLAFRFCVVWLGLYCLLWTYIPFALLGVAGRWVREYPGPWNTPFTDPVTGWVGRVFFGVDAVVRTDSGAGDQAAMWVLTCCVLVVALVATAVWSILDRRTAYPRLWAWFALALRLCLGATMLGFGFAKVFPTQMPGPSLAQLLQPYGEFSPASVLWLQVGSSAPYEIALGAVEVAAGLLLFVPRTAVLGAMATCAAMAQVLLLNLTFDIPEKLLAAHLLLMSLVLLAPALRPLTGLFLRSRACPPLTTPALFTADHKNRAAALAQLVLGLWVAFGCGYDRWVVWQDQYGAARATSPLYGIWDVSTFTLDGQPVPALITDEIRWRRIVFDDPGTATYQRMDGELVASRAEFGADGRLRLTETAGAAAPFATLTPDRVSPDRLLLRGELSGHAVVLTLDRVDPNTFTLRSRGFHWVQDYPYFR
ncbi:DoxX family protein [Nocardia rhizosphaerae]|uniref:DoxX family protein n=1 Tax=Nocardia rhizosphaerae TaxID=1691571 RepID=A0ABV8LC28_9NOCA